MKLSNDQRKKVEMKQIRQGDVYLKPCTILPDGMKKIKPVNGRIILAEGEATGHAHTMYADSATLFGVEEKMIVVVHEQTILEHQEHRAIEVAPGTYWVTRQREYSPKEIRRVMD